eukprot:462837_1
MMEELTEDIGILTEDKGNMESHEEESLMSENTDITHSTISFDGTDEFSQPHHSHFGSNSPIQQWVDMGRSHDFKLRGPRYPKNRCKLLSGPAIGHLLHFDLIECDEGTTRVDNIASIGACARRVQELQSMAGGQFSSVCNTQNGKGRFLFILALQVTGTPLVYAVLYWAIDPGFLSGDSTDPALRLLRAYVDLPVKEKPYIAKKISKPRNRLRMALSPMRSSQKPPTPQKTHKGGTPPRKSLADPHSPADNITDEGSEALQHNSFHASRFKVCVLSALSCLLTFARIFFHHWTLPIRLICVCFHNS